MLVSTLPDVTTVPLDTLDGTRLLDVSGTAVEVVRAGLPVAAFDDLQALLGTPSSMLAAWLDIAPRTLARRRSAGRFMPDESDRLLRLARLVELALAVFEDVEPAVEWLTTPKRLLVGESPLERADSAPGAREVEAMLYAIEFSAAA